MACRHHRRAGGAVRLRQGCGRDLAKRTLANQRAASDHRRVSSALSPTRRGNACAAPTLRTRRGSRWPAAEYNYFQQLREITKAEAASHGPAISNVNSWPCATHENVGSRDHLAPPLARQLLSRAETRAPGTLMRFVPARSGTTASPCSASHLQRRSTSPRRAAVYQIVRREALTHRRVTERQPGMLPRCHFVVSPGRR